MSAQKIIQNQPLIIEVRGKKPTYGENCYLAPTAQLIGDVTLGQGCSVWFNAILRGDVSPIVIGNETNIQDGVVIHGTYHKSQVHIEERVTVGHSVILHGCHIAKGCLIGMGAILMDNSQVGASSLVAAGSLLSEKSSFPAGVLIMGRPAKVVRDLKPEELQALEKSADNYLFYKGWYS